MNTPGGPSGTPDDATHTTEYSTFEGLFVRALDVDAEFAQKLKTVGFDLHRPVPRYPTRVWRDSLELARQRYYPQLAVREGRRELGRVALKGFLNTISGRLLGAALSTVISPAALIRRLPRFFTLTRTGVQMTVHEEGERQWRLVATDAFADPDFVSGIIELPGKKTKPTFTIEIASATPSSYELIFRW